MADGRRVLVVDDESMIRELIVCMLEAEGYVMEAADGGESALESIRSSPPDLVLIDLRMPRMNGWELIARLKELPAPPPVVAMSGMGVEAPPELRAIGSHVVGYMPKPFSNEQLVRTCARAFEVAAEQRAQVSAGAERRGHRRRSLLVPATVFSEEGTPAAVGQILNLGTGGAQIDLGAPLQPGMKVILGFEIPGGQGPFRVSGEVRWNAAGRLGLMFADLPEGDRKRLADLLSE